MVQNKIKCYASILLCPLFLLNGMISIHFAEAETKSKVKKSVIKNGLGKSNKQKMMDSFNTNANILFEGYSRVLSQGTPVGYVIYRYGVDDVAKKFYATYFLKTGKPLDATESLQAVADYEMSPVSYQYTSIAGKETRTVDAHFKGNLLTALITANGKTQKVEKKIVKGVFLSTFLFYLMLKGKEGLKVNNNFSFEALAEEDATVYSGQALIEKEELWKGFKVFRVIQKFKDMEYSSLINDRGEILFTSSPAQALSTEVVADPQALISQFGGESNLKSVFGGIIPLGKENMVSRAQILEEEQKRKPVPGKQYGIPNNNQLILKPSDNSNAPKEGK